MSTAEITAYLAGAELAHNKASVVHFLRMGRASRATALSQEEWDARERLGSDCWAYWVRMGFDDTVREMR